MQTPNKKTISQYSPSKTGFLALRSALDLFKKAEADFELLRANPQNAYAAFNFFVTAYHVTDWLKIPKSEIEATPVLKVCRHIADGLKHFELKNEKHTDVLDVVDESYVEDGYVKPGYFEQQVSILLVAGHDLAQNGKIEVTALAVEVLNHLRTKLEV